MGIEWDIRLDGRQWSGEEVAARWPLTPEHFELIDGKLFWMDEDRTNLLAMLLEQVGAQRAVRLGAAEVWRQAVAELDR